MKTKEELNNMKYYDLLKIASKCNLGGKRLKKVEMIEKILELNKQNGLEEIMTNNDWQDAAEVLNKEVVGTAQSNVRGTYNIQKSDNPFLDLIKDRRDTYNISNNQAFINQNNESMDPVNRGTFNIQKGDTILKESSIDRRGTYSLRPVITPRNTFSPDPIKQNEENEKLTKGLKSPLKGFKVTVPTSPKLATSARKRGISLQNKAQAASTLIPTLCRNAIPLRKSLSQQTTNKPVESTSRRVSKSHDRNLNRNVAKPVKKVDFLTPPTAGVSRTRNREFSLKPTPARFDIKKQDSKIPRVQQQTQFKFRPTKMPDFGSIHKRQFEKMDSLLDSQKKKTERARKLFGIIQTSELKTEKIEKPVAEVYKPATRPQSGHGQLRSAKIGLQTLRKTDVREKNRTVIQGVRSNKRFELQMKLRSAK